MVFDHQKWAQLGLYDNFIAVLTGYLYVNVSGLYNFWSNSDDASRLWIDNSVLVVENGVMGTIHLSRGFHAVSVHFVEAWGQAFLSISYSGADTGGMQQPLAVQPPLIYLSYSDGLDPPNTLPAPDEWTFVCATSRAGSPVLVNGIERSRSC
jgi:hypothetical protein